MPPKIEYLSAAQVARHAFNVFLFSGRHQTGAKLIYHALRLDPVNAEALRCLSDLLDTEGTEIFSAVVLEYALSDLTGISGEDRDMLDNVRFLAQWTWGFSRHKSGDPHLGQEAFSDRGAFNVDEERYRAFLQQIIGPAGSLFNGFRAAHTLCGVMTGFLKHEELGESVGMKETLYPDRFLITADYADWLQTSTEELDALERARQERSQHNR